MVQLGLYAQKTTVIDHKGTLVKVTNNLVTTSDTAPTDPSENDIWLDTVEEVTKIYDGAVWLTINLDALAKKEDSANKSSDTNLSDNTNTKFPTELAVRSYVETKLLASVDDDITGVSFDGTNLKVDEGLTTFSADLSALEESADISANTTAIVAHNSADGDLSATNELSDVVLSGTILNLTNPVAGATGVDLDATFATDAEVAATTDDDITAVSFDGTNLIVNEGATAFSADLSTLEESVDIAANTAAIDAHNTADGDLSSTNEIQTLSISGSDLSISGTGGNTVTLPSVAGTQGSIFFADTDGTATENNGQFFWDNANARLGIGTITPTNELEVNGKIRATSIVTNNGTAGAPAYSYNSDENTGMFRAAFNELAFSTGGDEALRIDSSSQVGIGTSTPEAQLAIESTGVPLKIEPNATTPTGTSGGQMFVGDDGILYIYDGSRGKWLSVDRTMVGWGRNSASASNEYLRQFNGALSSGNGWHMIRDGTITAISGQTNTADTWILQIRKNDDQATVITSLAFVAQEGNHDSTVNIDINEGDFIQAFASGTGIDFPQVLIEIAWRK